MPNIYILFLKSIIIFKILKLSFSETESESECDYDTPIRIKSISDECISGDCTEIQYTNSYCSIENEKIKKQWLNDFILFYGDGTDFNYIDIYTSLNGNLVALATSSDEFNTIFRIFYILKNTDGRGYFLDEYTTDDYPYHVFENGCTIREHPNIFTFKINNDNIDDIEYFISVSNDDSLEMYHMDKENGDYITSVSFYNYFEIDFINSFVNVFNKLDDNNYVLGFVGNNNGKYYFYLFYLHFTNFNYFSSSNILQDYTKSYESSNSTIVSCFESEHKYLICFYQDNSFNYQEIVFDQNYESKKNDIIVDGPLNEDNYFEGVHFTGETAAFLYYNGSNPTIIFKEYNINTKNIINHFNSIE